MKNMVFDNLVMKNVPRPIFMTFCQQRAYVDSPDTLETLKAMHHFSFNNFIVDNSELDKNSVILITGMPGHTIDHISMSNIQFTVAGGGTAEDAQKLQVKEYTPEVLKNHWPEYSLIGPLPAYGVYARHIKGLTMNNVVINTIGTDARSPVVLHDVENANIDGSFTNHRKLEGKEILQLH